MLINSLRWWDPVAFSQMSSNPPQVLLLLHCSPAACCWVSPWPPGLGRKERESSHSDSIFTSLNYLGMTVIWAEPNIPMSSWMVTRSRTLKEVSSLSGWLHRWHTKLTCMVVLEDLEPSITERIKWEYSKKKKVESLTNVKLSDCYLG